MSKKYKIQKAIVMLFIIVAFTSALVLNASAAQAVSDDAAIIYLFPDGINVPISDFGVDIDTSEYVNINPYDYIPVEAGDALLTFNKGQLMWYEYVDSYTNEYIKQVESLIGYPDGRPEAFITLQVEYIEYDWTSAPNHFNVHFCLVDSSNGFVWNDGTADGNSYYQPPYELWIYDTSQMKVDESNPILFYMVTQGMLFENKAYGRGFVNGRQRNDGELKEFYNNAYDAGYQAGVATVPVSPGGDNSPFGGLFRTVIMTPVEVARDFLDFNIFGTNVGAFIFGLIGLMIVIAVIITVIKLIL